MPPRLTAYGLLLALALAGCTQPHPQRPVASAVTEATVTVVATSPIPVAIAPPVPSPAATSPYAPVADGTYHCYIHGIDGRGGGALRVVFATVFTGAEAQQAAQQADEQLAPGVHSYVRVDDPQERRLELRGLKPPTPLHDGLYRVTIRDGAVASFAEEKLR